MSGDPGRRRGLGPGGAPASAARGATGVAAAAAEASGLVMAMIAVGHPLNLLPAKAVTLICLGRTSWTHC